MVHSQGIHTHTHTHTQTIGALGGMKNGIELLANDELSVVANACVAISRLVFDFMSGVDFIEAEGVYIAAH
jgi:hypothetical protein